MLSVKNLEVHYGMIKAIKDVSFEVNQGEVIALIGANGASCSIHVAAPLVNLQKSQRRDKEHNHYQNIFAKIFHNKTPAFFLVCVGRRVLCSLYSRRSAASDFKFP